MSDEENLFLVLSRKRSSDSFARSVFDDKGERTERLIFNKTKATEIESESQFLAIADDIGGALLVSNKSGDPDHDATKEFCAAVAQNKIRDAEGSGVPATLSFSQRAAIVPTPEAIVPTPEAVEGEQEETDAEKAEREALEQRQKELEEEERKQDERDRVSKEKEEKRKLEIEEEKIRKEKEDEEEAKRIADEKAIADEIAEILKDETPLTDLEGWDGADLKLFVEAGITTHGQALAHEDLTQIKGIGKSRQAELLDAIAAHSPAESNG